MKQEAPKPRKKKEIELFVARSGPIKGKPECEAAFQTKDEAMQFLASQHGLEIDEMRKLSRELALPLNRKWHGAETCAISLEPMSPTKAKQALSGELYAPKVNPSELPTPRAISMKTTLNIKLKKRKPSSKAKARAKPKTKTPVAAPKPTVVAKATTRKNGSKQSTATKMRSSKASPAAPVKAAPEPISRKTSAKPNPPARRAKVAG